MSVSLKILCAQIGVIAKSWKISRIYDFFLYAITVNSPIVTKTYTRNCVQTCIE